MSLKTIALAATAVAAFAAVPSAAGPLNISLPANAYITFGGLDWAWANPCDPTGGCGDIDLTFQSTEGWRLPTAAEFAARPIADDFFFAGANVPGGGSGGLGETFFGDGPVDASGAVLDGACASVYFSVGYKHCDYFDGVAGFIFDPVTGSGGIGAYETWLVRGGVVPEPATWAMLITGFGLVGFAARRRTAATA